MEALVDICLCSGCAWNLRANNSCEKSKIKLDNNGKCESWEKPD